MDNVPAHLLPGSPSSILLAFSESTLRHTLETSLLAEGYHVVMASDGDAALALARMQPLSLVLLDLALPRQDGLEVCRQLRSDYATAYLPIVLLTTHHDETEMIVGLEVGADEYITVPLHWNVFRARIRALLRRSGYTRRRMVSIEQGHAARSEERELEREEQTLVRGDLCIDLAGRTVLLGGHPIDLSARLFDLLVVLARHPNSVLTRQELLRQIQLESGGERLLDSYVHWLREKLDGDPVHPQPIQTVRGIGYRFVCVEQEKTGPQ